MFTTDHNNHAGTVTTPGVVIPFYVYAALSFLWAVFLLCISPAGRYDHYFSPHTLAITHAMALGWGTMIILGASHQLVPVLAEGKLYSHRLAYLTFILAGVGIPLLVYAFYTFNMGVPAKAGAILINSAVLLFLVNVICSRPAAKNENVHVVFVITATCWLFMTTFAGLLLVYNFTHPLLRENSLHYLPLHAHMGIVGWFLLLITGVGSRLIPMFLVSKYTNTKQLWWIYALVNGGLTGFVLLFLYVRRPVLYFLPVACLLAAIVIFICYCYGCYRERIRRQVDGQVKISLLSVLMMIIPLVLLAAAIGFLLTTTENTALVLIYGFSVFFGWLTAIILGMTFKTLPFIVWNKLYHVQAGAGKTPSPKDLFSSRLFNLMALSYLLGFLLFVAGVFAANGGVVRAGAVLLLLCAFLYNLNIFRVTFYKPGWR